MKRLLEWVVLPWLAFGLVAGAFLLYVFAPRESWIVLFAFVVWRCHWLRRDAE